MIIITVKLNQWKIKFYKGSAHKYL